MASMKQKWRALALLVIACLFGGALGPDLARGGGRKGKFFISFHVQGDESEGKRRVEVETINGQTVYFSRTPVITHKQLDGYWPFPAEDGTFGAAFHLTTSGQRRLSTIGLTERGRLIRTVVNMRKVDVLYIDRPPEDNMIVVWKGLTDEDLKQIAKLMPQIGK